MHSGDGLRPMLGKHQVAAPSTALSRGGLMLLIHLSSYSSHMVGHTDCRAWQTVILCPLPSLHGKEGSPFPVLVPTNNMVNS